VARRGHPRFCPRYPIGTCAAGNGGVRSSRDNVSSLRRSGRESVSRHGDCQHQGGRGLGWGGTVNPGEVSLNVVNENKPKVLLQNGFAVPAAGRLQNQAWAKRQVVRCGGFELLRRRCRTTGGETRPKPLGLFRLRNVVSPLSRCLGAARGVARGPEGAAGKGGGSKPRPPSNRADRG
jgi:hypothetical protein